MAFGQAPVAPVIDPRGLTDFFTQEPAPATIAGGGILQITGLNLGPPEGAFSSGIPLATQLGDVQVLINGKPAPLFSATPGKILAQVPQDARNGQAEVVVQRASGASRPARITIRDRRPSVRTADDSGYGAAWAKLNNTTLTLAVTGLGETDPPIASGDAGPQDPPAKPVFPVSVFIGGIRAPAVAAASAERVGEFDVTVDVPAGARPGDLINVFSGRIPSQRTVFQPMQSPEVQFVPLPDGSPDLRDLVDTDLNGNFLIASGARDSSGCYPAVVFDMVKKQAATWGACLISTGQNAPTPIMAPADSDVLGALVGPATGDSTTGVSSKMQLFRPAADPMSVDLPSPALLLAPVAGGDFAAVLGGTPQQVVTIDGTTGEVSQGGNLPAGVRVGGGIQNVSPNLNVDGLTHALSSPVVPAPGRIALLVADDPDAPTKTKFAVLNLTGGVAVTKDFPSDWLPLLAGKVTTPFGGGGAVIAAIPRGTLFYDPVTRVFYSLARAPDNSKHAFVAFTSDNAPPKILPLPAGWFVSGCVANIRISMLELSRRAVVAAGRVAISQITVPSCAGQGFIQLDLDNQAVSVADMPPQAQINVGNVAEMNDYVYTTAVDASRRDNTADTLYVLDGVTGSTFTLAVPTGIKGFGISLRRIPELSSLTAAGTDQRAGDQGLVVFNLDLQTTSTLRLPDGFAAATELEIFSATRKLAARGLRPGGSQLLIYDLRTGEVTVVANPDGVASFGPSAQQSAPPGPGGGPLANLAARLVAGNTKANTVAAVAYDRSNKQVGVIVVRVP